VRQITHTHWRKAIRSRALNEPLKGAVQLFTHTHTHTQEEGKQINVVLYEQPNVRLDSCSLAYMNPQPVTGHSLAQ
jgi:hypothetical protein